MTTAGRGRSRGRNRGFSLALALALLLTAGFAAGAQDGTPSPVASPGASPSASPGATPAAGADALMAQYGPVQGARAYRLAFLQVFPDNPFWQTLKEAVEARAAQNGVTVETIALPTTGTIADQVAQLEDAVTQQYDGIILGTIDAAGVVQGVAAANAAGIPVLAVDTAPAGGELISLVQTDNVAAAAQAGQFIADAIGGSGKVLNLQGDLANQTGQARNEGLHQVLDTYPEIQVIDQSTMWQGAEGLRITENILTSDPDIKAIFAANDPPALGAIQALKAAGRSDVVVVGFDGTADGLQAIVNGDLAADIAQFPQVMGTVGVDLMVRHLNGEPVPATVDSGSAVITPDNVAEFLS